MARLAESPELLEQIRQKAMENSQILDTIGKKAEFKPGPVVVDFESHCKRLRHLGNL